VGANKYDSIGQEQWVEHYDGPANGDDSPSGIALDSSGNVYVTGASTGVNASSDYATVKYNPAGLRQWIARYDNPETHNDDFAKAITVDSSNNVYVTGASWVLGGGDDYATIEYDSAGQEQWMVRYNEVPGPSVAAVALDSSDNVCVAGWGGFYPDYYYVTVKHTQGGSPTPTATPRATPRPRPVPYPRPTPP
jgi:Beta-propeller repeat